MTPDIGSVAIDIAELRVEVKALSDRISSSLSTTEKNITELWTKHNNLIEKSLPQIVENLHAVDKRLLGTESDARQVAHQVKEIFGFLNRLERSIEDNRKNDDKKYNEFEAIVNQGKGMRLLVVFVVAVLGFYITVKEFSAKEVINIDVIKEMIQSSKGVK